MYHFRYISFKLFVLLFVMPLELVGITLSSFGAAFQALSHAIGEGLFVNIVGEMPEPQNLSKLMDLRPKPGQPEQDLPDDNDE